MSSNMSRRTALTQGGLGLLAASGLLGTQRPCTAEPQQRGEFTLPPLPYAVDATGIHHDKHHQAYVTNLNHALKGQHDQHGKSIEYLLSGLASLPESIRTAVRNNGGGHYNHSLFWTVMKPHGGGEPKGGAGGGDHQGFGKLCCVQSRLYQGRRRLDSARDGRGSSGVGMVFCPSARRPTRTTH